MRIPGLLLPLLAAAAVRQELPRPEVTYIVHLDSARTDVIDVTMRVRHAAPRTRLAMKVHPEYDARFWRYLEPMSSNLQRADTTLWIAHSAGGSLEVRYRIRLPADDRGPRRAWRTTVRADGALINPPDVFLYLPDFPRAAATVDIDAPASWRIATSLDSAGSARRRRAPDAAVLLDSPIMLGRLHEWPFTEHGARFTVAWWPLPNAPAFDSVAFVQTLHALTHQAVDLFGAPSASAYWFLVQDATDALEHRASITIGVPSAELARDPRARLTEIAHELFHSWNLVAIHPDAYGTLRYTRTPATSGLWWGEGVTMYYADALPRRAGLTDSASSRAMHVEGLLERYYAAWWSRTVSPEASSLALGQSALANPNATGGYYLQGELLGNALDAAIRDSTHDARTLDDVMRSLFIASDDGSRGFTAEDLRRVVDSVCSCQLNRLFATTVSAPGLIDLNPAMSRLGWRIVVDTVPAMGANGAPLADLRVGTATIDDSTLAMVVTDPAGPWATAGLRSGDRLKSLNGTPVSTFLDFFNATRRLRVGDTAHVTALRGARVMHFDVPMVGYRRPRVRLVDQPVVTQEQRARRVKWLAGW